MARSKKWISLKRQKRLRAEGKLPPTGCHYLKCCAGKHNPLAVTGCKHCAMRFGVVPMKQQQRGVPPADRITADERCPEGGCYHTNCCAKQYSVYAYSACDRCVEMRGLTNSDVKED